MLCETLNVSRSAYYAWRQEELGERQRDDNRFRPMIRSLFWEHKRRYGARRIAVELAARQESCSRRRVGRLMAGMGLAAIQPRSFKPRTTDSRHTLGYSPNLLIEAAPPHGFNQPWVGDITYIVARRRNAGLIHPTDRAGQYAAAEYRKMLARAAMPQSMSRAAHCYDNAFMESCFATIKTELEMKPYENERIARKEVPDTIRYYNTRRRHSALDYLSPEAFEALTK